MLIFRAILLLIFGTSLFLHASSKHILLLQSYNKGLMWSDDISKGVEDVFKPYQNYELTTEYMDTKKNEDKEYLQHLYELFATKLKHQTFDVIIAADNDAVNFVFTHKETLFKNTPFVFCGIDKRDPGLDIQKILDAEISLILESKEIKRNIDFILSLLPELEHLYIINDRSGASLLVNHIYEREAKALEEKGIKTTFNCDGNISQIKEDLDKLPKKSAILFGSLFRDALDRYIPYYKVNDLLKSAPVPLFSVSDSHLSKGVIGGYLLRGYTQGSHAAKRALEILQHTVIDTSKPIVVPSEWMFDYEVAQKYQIPLSKLPKGSTMIHLPQSFFDKHRKVVEYAFVLFPFILFFLVIALFNIYQRHKIEKRLIAQSYREQVLLNNIRSSIFWIDRQGLIKGCNQSFCDMVGWSYERIVGRNIDDVFTILCDMPKKEALFALGEIEFMRNENVFMAKSKLFLDEDGKNGGIVTIITDMTEKKQLEINKQFIIQQSKLAEIGEMLSAIVHQWKVPLVELSAVAHKMHYYDQKGKLTHQEIQNFYDVIMTQTIYMSDTIDGFRDFIRPSTKPSLFCIDKGLKEVLDILSYSMKYNTITLVYKNALHKGHTLFGYPNEFKQVILNIINNAKDAILEARKSTHEKRGVIKIMLYELDDAIGLSIEDDGIGIALDSEKNLFKPFFTTKEKGDGFGLYMAKLIIENKMHGKISIEPLEKGTQVLIMLPRSQEEGCL
ncbi:ATP-binding protein [Sulfurospirillum barnesii]|uniref:histidine kinase n=1 Tax=Sulfurospirillum barnesii (strain ATCC 700032 / DSM 10660 / SES-3) TaxID=760154 RepID=I3XW78_SULBS|nr:ATP-binding protein [Sulfurospirillum barnesii]AFL68202.1 PAS domain S-box [Sulfurospirillum barnesii SES-3]